METASEALAAHAAEAWKQVSHTLLITSADNNQHLYWLSCSCGLPVRLSASELLAALPKHFNVERAE